MINHFSAQHAFLSNFAPSPINIKGKVYVTYSNTIGYFFYEETIMPKSLIARRKQQSAVCPICKSPDYTMSPNLSFQGAKPDFACCSCGNLWQDGYDGGVYAKLATVKQNPYPVSKTLIHDLQMFGYDVSMQNSEWCEIHQTWRDEYDGSTYRWAHYLSGREAKTLIVSNLQHPVNLFDYAIVRCSVARYFFR